MALTYINVTIAGETKQAIEVTPTPQTVILKEFLSDADIRILTRASNASGSTFLQKMQNTNAPNGIKCSDMYASFIVDPVVYSVAVEETKRKVSFDGEVEVSALQQRVTKLEQVTISTSNPVDADGKPDGAIWYKVI